MANWDRLDQANKNAQEKPPLPDGSYWVRIARASSYDDKNGDPTVVLTLVELGAENPRQHSHFERYVEDPDGYRMKFVHKTLRALGASEELIGKAKASYQWLGSAHKNECAGYEYRIEIATRTGSQGGTFVNAEFKEKRPRGQQSRDNFADQGGGNYGTGGASAGTYDNWDAPAPTGGGEPDDVSF